MARYTLRQLWVLAHLIGRNFTLAKLKLAVQQGLQVSLETYSVENSLPSVIITLCRKVNEQELIKELLDGLKSVNNDPDLAIALDEFFNGPAMTGELAEVLLVSELPAIPVINRETLRGHLASLVKNGSAFRAISISGPSACGKTHSTKLIRYAAAKVGAIVVTVVVADETRTLGMLNALLKIASGMRYGRASVMDLIPDSPGDAQAAERFVDWLGGESQDFANKGYRYWIVLDGLNRETAAAFRELLVPKLLCAAANGNLSNVEIFLLGDNAKRIGGDARHLVLHEDALNITDVEIGTFIDAYAQNKGIELKEDEIAALTTYVVGNTAPPYDHAAMEAIVDRLKKVLLKLSNPQTPASQLLKVQL